MRFWSPEQKYLLEVLKKTGCMRKSQALTLLHRQFGTSPNAIGPICRQLRDAGYLREFDGVISAVGPQYEPFIPNAIDLILAIFPRELPIFERTARNSLYALGAQSGLLARVFFSLAGTENIRTAGARYCRRACIHAHGSAVGGRDAGRAHTV